MKLRITIEKLGSDASPIYRDINVSDEYDVGDHATYLATNFFNE